MMDITADIVSDFRYEMSAFEDDTTWPDSVVYKALCRAEKATGSTRWGSYAYDRATWCGSVKAEGLFNFAAHWLSTTYTTAAGATDPSVIKPSARLNISSKSVGDESVSYRITAIQETGDDWLSLTDYGVQYYRLRKRIGMGAIAV